MQTLKHLKKIGICFLIISFAIISVSFSQAYSEENKTVVKTNTTTDINTLDNPVEGDNLISNEEENSNNRAFNLGSSIRNMLSNQLHRLDTTRSFLEITKQTPYYS